MANENQSNLHVMQRGEGTPLVLLHGFPFDHALWRAQLHGLEGAGVRVIAPDLPGFGRSPSLAEGEASMDSYADAIAQWAKEEGLGKFILAGHSMGGYIAFAFVRRYAEMLSGLVLVCTRPGADSEAAREGRYKLIEEVRKRGPQAVVDAMLPKLFAPSTAESQSEAVDDTRQMMLRQSDEGIIAAIRAMAERPDSTSGLEAINVPTLIITGAEDAIIPAPEAEGMMSRISGARHVPIANAGHLPMIEQPDAFNEALNSFINSSH
ncbi:MAG TPA: alpha/beta fold hydrolase [Chloroflexia bacterium]|nr:alpha/beta fold hydrolase [Chloroflexia bacterium]